MKILVTGGAGFIGSHIVEYLVQRGDNVTILDNLNTGKIENLSKVKTNINFVNGDIRDYKLLESLVNDSDGVFQEAALASVKQSFKMQDEYFDINVYGTENILKLAKEYDFKVVYASSSSVYGHQDVVPILENFEKKPINPYGKTKLDDEILAERYAKQGTSIIGLRYFNIFGKGQTLEYAGVITKFLDKLRDKESPIIFGTGSQIRDFIHVEDIAKANLLAMESDVSFTHANIGTGNSISILELANIMIDISGLKLEPIMEKALEGDIEKSQSNNSLARKLFNWKPEKRLEDWLKETIK